MPRNSPETSDLDRFIYIVSHDVRAGLRPLIELPDWISEDVSQAGVTLPEEAARNLDYLGTRARRLDRMMLDLLAYARIGRMGPAEAVPLREAVGAVRDGLGLPATFRLRITVPGIEVWMPPDELQALLTHVIGNSHTHHDRDTGRIEVSARVDGDRCWLWVVDDGPGIEPRHRDLVFEPMATLKAASEGGGSGMGLAIARRIAEANGGSLVLGDADGRGTVIEAVLPVARREAAQ